MEETSSTQPAKRSWTRRIIFLAVVLVALGGTIGGGYYLQNSPCTIVVNGKPVTTVQSRLAARHVLVEAKARNANGAPSELVKFADRVTLRTVSSKADVSGMDEAVTALSETAPAVAELYAVSVEGTPLVALRSKAEAEHTLAAVKRHYEEGLTNLVGSSTFKEDVFVERRFVSTKLFRKTPEAASRVLTSVSEPALVHTIKRGDRAVHVARQYGIAMSELKSLNPGANLEQMTEGNKLLVRRAKMPVTVVSRSNVAKTVAITAPPDMARYSGRRTGKREMQLRVTYENGRPVSQDIISQITTWDRPQSHRSEERTYTRRRSHR